MKLSMVVELVDRLTGPVQRMTRSFQGLERLAERGRGMVEAGQRLAITGAFAQEAAGRIRGALGSMLAPVVALQDAMAPLATVTTSTLGSVQASMAATLQAARSWAKEHTQAADEFIRTAYAMASAGLTDVQAIEGTRVALQVATATMGESAEAAELIATLYNNMGDKSRDLAEEMGRLGDVVTRTQQMFQLRNLGQLSEGLKYAIPSAIQFGDSLESVATVIGALNSAGLQGSQAGTAYAASLRQMLRASRLLGFEIARTESGGVDFIETLVRIRERFGDTTQWSDEVAMAFQQAFGDEGMRAVSLLIGNLDQLRAQLGQVRSSTGAAAAAQAEMEATLSAQWRIAQNQFNDLKMTVAGALVPAIQRAIPVVRGAVAAFQRFAEAHPNLMRTAVLVAGLGAVALSVAAPIFTVVAGLTLMGGHGLQAAARMGRALMWLSGVLRSARLAHHLRTVGVAFRQIGVAAWEAAVRAGRATIQFAGLLVRLGATGAAAAGRFVVGLALMGRQALITAVRAMPALIASMSSFTAALLANPITWVVLALVGLGAAIYLLIRHWDQVTEATRGAWAGVTGAISRAVGGIRTNLGSLVRWVATLVFPPLALVFHWDSVRQGMEEAGGFLPWAYAQLQSVLASPLRLLGIDASAFFASIDQALEWIRAKIEAFRQAGSDLWNAFTSGMQSLITKPVEAVRGAFAWIENLLPHSNAPEGPLSRLSESGRALVITLAEGVASAMPALHRAVAAGLAGIALAAPRPAMASPAPAPSELRGPMIYAPQMPAVPHLPDLTGRARYELVSPLRTPALPELRGRALYVPELLGAPSLPDVTGNARYELARMPDLEPAAATEAMTMASAEGSTRSRLAGPPRREAPPQPARQLVVRGDLIVHIDQVRDEEDLLRRLWMAAEEGGFE